MENHLHPTPVAKKMPLPEIKNGTRSVPTPLRRPRPSSGGTLLASLDCGKVGKSNKSMNLLGKVKNGVLVLEGKITLPEGMRVAVSPIPQMPPTAPQTEPKIVIEPGKLPSVRGGIPGTWTLPGERIAQIFADEDIETMKDL